MTRNEFIETVEDFGDLKSFCDENNIDTCDYVMDEEYYGDVIMGRIQERGYFDTWQEVYRFLHELPDGANYYIENDYGEFSEATEEDFEDYKQEVLEYMDRHGEWDVEEDDGEDTYEPDDEHDVAEELEPEEVEISDDEFFAVLRKAS